ncbi:ANKRD27 [Lepeophtheirus salmonis]|uniref:ANKRD27 n=1 Tax=Lepeophtheirus salmonis TaxID=72036 RepID=A0A7R8CC17_LEPSM|nr:ANKRD27 [Lepeophtheirus salmonis]CAF2766025.1 ANKRD27 [Lepeophtheirus salmonis]
MSIASSTETLSRIIKYDENLENNSFLKGFRDEFPDLFQKTIHEKWTIAIPRQDSLPSELSLRPEDVSRHIFIPDEEGIPGKYCSLADKRLQINQKNQIKVMDSEGNSELVRQILFSEVFYNDDLQKYNVLCLDAYLGEDPSFKTDGSIVSDYKLSCVEDCIQYLFRHVDTDVIRKIEASCSNFDPDKSLVGDLIKSSFKKLKQTSKSVNIDLLESSLETYILYNISTPLSNKLKNDWIEKNALLNRSIKSLAITDIFGKEWKEENNRVNIMKSKTELGEYEYLLASLEAALEYLMHGIPTFTPSVDIQSENAKVLKMFSAVRSSDVQSVCQILYGGKDSLPNETDSVDEAQHHPLCNCEFCLKKDYYPSVNYQENHFADPTIVDIKYRTPLHLASQFGHQNVILLILQCPSSRIILNSQDQNGHTPLHLSILYGHESSTKAILYFAEHQSYPLQIDLRDKFGDTALHLGASYGYLSIVKLLLDYSANVQIRNKRNQTPIDVSMCSKIKDLIQSYSSKLLVNYFNDKEEDYENPVEVEGSPQKFNTNIFKSKKEKFFKSIIMGDLELTCHYLGVNHVNETFRSRVLYQSSCYPVCGGCEDCDNLLKGSSSVKEILQRPGSPPMNVNATNDEGKNCRAEPFSIAGDIGETPLHLACQNGHLGVVTVLTQNASQFRQNIDIKDKMGNTPLQYASMSGHYEIALKLLSFGASVKTKNFAGHSAVDVANYNNNKILSLLFKKYN